MRKLIFSTIVMIFFTIIISAQSYKLSSEIRPRYEYANGVKTLVKPGDEGVGFVSQRTRLNFNFAQDNLRLGISLQNIRVWGDVGTLSSSDKGNAFHEAWAEMILSNIVSIKFGRQEIVYDDSRIFGNVGWSQQARSHDAAIAKFNFKNGNKLDVGLAINNDSQKGTNYLYSNVAGYKTFQYAWYHTNFNSFDLSLLALNNGVEYLDVNNKEKLSYGQTIGARGVYKEGKLSADAAFYFQTGNVFENAISANYFSGNATYKASRNFTVGLGFEYLSGKDMNDTSSKLKSFNPIFGTNHKFNGWMDYFYVGNHINSVGLTDIYATFAYSKNKFSAKLVPHFFSSAASIYSGGIKQNNNLGTEIDFTLGYKASKDIVLSSGYSRMFGTKSLEVIKGGDSSRNNSWAWLMVTVKPTLFASK
tara:strand:+ start:567 stop:1820 length:1254 start_codon:yes stop_codon:yes gene_type:complete